MHSVSMKRRLVFDVGPIVKEFVFKIFTFLDRTLILFKDIKIYVIQMCNVFYRYSSSMIPQSSQIILMLVVPGKCHEFPDAF